MVEVPLSRFGLLTVAEAATRLGRSASGVQKLIQSGYLPVVVVGAGKRTVHLVRTRDVDRFTPPPRGRPPGSRTAARAAAHDTNGDRT